LLALLRTVLVLGANIYILIYLTKVKRALYTKTPLRALCTVFPPPPCSCENGFSQLREFTISLIAICSLVKSKKLGERNQRHRKSFINEIRKLLQRRIPQKTSFETNLLTGRSNCQRRGAITKTQDHLHFCFFFYNISLYLSYFTRTYKIRTREAQIISLYLFYFTSAKNPN
jgi:hypothetical protein